MGSVNELIRVSFRRKLYNEGTSSGGSSFVYIIYSFMEIQGMDVCRARGTRIK